MATPMSKSVLTALLLLPPGKWSEVTEDPRGGPTFLCTVSHPVSQIALILLD